jgi:glycine dehydrogenase subunit 1
MQIAALPGFSLAFDGPFFHEFAVRTPVPGAALRDALLERGILAGIPLDGQAGIEHGLLVCVTEQNRKSDIDALVTALQEVAA